MAEPAVRAAGGAVGEGTDAVVDRALQRMRLLAAAVLIFQAVVHRGSAAASPWVVLGWSLLVLAVLWGLSWGRQRWRGSLTGLLLAGAAHLVEVVAAVAAVGLNRQLDAAWVLLVVPVLGGALRFRLRGAFLSWLAVGGLHLTWAVSAADTADLAFAGYLGQEVARVAVVLLVALPAGYLSEHLLIEVHALARVSAAAEQRSGLLEVVAASGQRLNALDSHVFQAALEAAGGLGFTSVDLWELSASGWRPLGRSGDGDDLAPVDAHLRHHDVAGPPLVLERGAGDRVDDELLRAAGLSAVVLTAVPGRRATTLLRAALPAADRLRPSQVEALQLLARQAGVALRNGELVADLQQARADLEHQAFHDDLTQIPNRALFLRRLEEVAGTSAAAGRTFAVLFCDLDRFKAVNDGLGHDVGNALLVAAVERLQGCLRSDVLLARIGGDEFTLLLPEVADPQEALQVAERVCRVLTRPFALAGHEVVISTSVGIAFGGAECSSPGELLRRGDVAMYRSKARGRGCWTVWGEELEEATAGRLRLERDLRRAVDDGEIDVAFQPVVTADGTVAGVETLARWRHPQLGEVSPAQFIAIAEDSDLIVDLGRLVLRRAFAVAGPWLARAGDAFVAVNVSPRELASAGFAEELDDAVLAAGLRPAQVLLEITERIVGTGDDAVESLHDLARRGYRLALDDFGQGQTSLQHLRHFPLSALKIDRGFVADAVVDPRVRTILASIVDLGLALDLEVIAEGIESAEQAALLASMGCTYLQGYAIAVPALADELPPAGSRGAAVVPPVQA